MAIEFILSYELAVVIAITMPFVVAVLSYFLSPRLRELSGSKLRRYLSYLVKPPAIGASESSWRTDKVRLFFYYIGVSLFLVSLIIGQFYETMIDLSLPVTQGSTGEMRLVTSLIFQNLLTVQWLGSLPWMGVYTYHETWSWIFFTAAFTDNPNFLPSIIVTMTLLSIGVGLVFLAPLAIKRIKESFLPSMFFFTTGMTIFTKAAISWLAYGIALFFGITQLEYITLSASGEMIPGLSTVIIIGVPIFLAMLGFFMVLGRKLWKVHYEDPKSKKWFMVYITLSLCLGLLLTIIMV